MSVLRDVDLLGALKQNQISSVYLLYGNEHYTLSRCLHLLLRQAVGEEAQSFNLNRFKGDKIELSDVMDALKTAPVLSPRRAVALMDPPSSFFSGPSLNLLSDYCKHPVDTTVFVLAIEEEALCRLKGFKTLCSIIEKTGEVVHCSSKTSGEISRFLISIASKSGCMLEKAEATYLIDRCGKSLTLLTQEMKKLTAYADGKKITKEIIDHLTAPSVEITAFDLSRALLRKQKKEAFLLLKQLYSQKLDEIQIISAVNLSFMDLYRAKCAELAHESPSVILHAFAAYKGKDFRLKKASKEASHFSMAQIKKAIAILYETDRNLKLSKADKRLLVEKAMAQMLLIQDEVNPK